jgi:hypothetical protein
MNNMFLGGIKSTKKELKENVYFDIDDITKYFETPQIIKLLRDARNWLNKGTYEQYSKKLDSQKYFNYIDRFEKMRDKVAIKLGAEPITAKYYNDFGDYVS